MLIGCVDRLVRLYQGHRRSRRSSSSSSRLLYNFLYNKWYFDELYNFIFVQARLLAWPPVLEARRCGDHRPLRPQWRRLGGGSRAPCREAGPVGISLYLCAGHAARPGRGDQLGDGAADDERLSHPFADAAGAAGRRAAPACLSRRETARADRAGRDAGRSRARHRAVGRITISAARSGSSSRRAELFAGFAWALGHRRHRADADRAVGVPDADLHRRELEFDQQARRRIHGRLPVHGNADDRRLRGAGLCSCSTSSSKPA